jgi:undecaprenyl-diphosphatase
MVETIHTVGGRAVAAVKRDQSARVLIAGAMTLFVVLAALAVLNEGALLRVDTAVQGTSMEARQDWLNTAMVMLTELGTRYVIGVLAAGIAAWAWLTGRCRTTVAVVLIAFALNPAFEVLFKELVGRVRPNLDQILPGNGPSFPSGHVLASVGFYGMLPLIVWEATARRWTRIAALAGSLLIILIVGASRVYLDVHWTTDVIAGWILGTVLVAASYHALRGHNLDASRNCCRT